ncbi:acyltransferase [Shewanella sp. A32]|uniref:acyltransferase family protein n=1 Tax=Shewanella sp. A32 TaxID=3031327 RepID=UPI0023BA135B|nr:acyltransferase [Shewanella sp. A32]MDF0533017.1 acyltransferase [Shewanella sp. A32]
MSLLVRIKHLDGMRGLAIMLVVMYHSFYRWHEIEPYEQIKILKDIFQYGWLGVQLFFAISGFVIFMSLHNSENISVFLTKRWLRLFPLMLICSLFIIFYQFIMGDNFFLFKNEITDIIPGIFFIDPETLNTIFNTDFNSLDGAFWSIYIEVKFYILVSVFYFIFRDKKLYSIFILYLIFFFLKVLKLFDIKFTILLDFLEYLGVSYYAWFIVGISLYQYKNLSDNRYILCSIFFGILGCLQLIGNGFLVTAIALFLLFIFVCSFFSSIVQRILNYNFLIFLGAVSYPLYLFHQKFIISFSIFFGSKNDILDGYQNFFPLIFLFLSIFIAFIFSKLESPLRKFFSSIIYKLKLV